jgi:hypothetical protein
MLHVADTVETLNGIIAAVRDSYWNRPKVVQVIAVPMGVSFPLYDFFILHKQEGVWTVASDYQCKQGAELPSAVAWDEISLSVWVEGRYRWFRIQDGIDRVSEAKIDGWVMLGELNQHEFLGIWISEALPQDPAVDNPNCSRGQREERGES